MNKFIENFMQRPKKQRIALGSTPFLVCTLLFWQLFYKNQSIELSKITEKIESLQSEKFNQQKVAKDLPKFELAVKDLEARLKLAIKELPDQREIPNLLSSISDLAKDAGLEVSLFKPKPESYKDFYAEVPVAITVDGTYHQVATFFDDVGRLPRIVNISDIGIKEPKVTKGDNKVAIKAFCTATTFRYLDDEEREKLNKKDAVKETQKGRRK